MKEEAMILTEEEALLLRRARTGLAPSSSQRDTTLARLTSLLVMSPHGFENPLADGQGMGRLTATSAAAPAARYSLHALVTGVVTGVAVGFSAGFLVGSDNPSTEPSHVAPAPPPRTPARDTKPRARTSPTPKQSREAPASTSSLPRARARQALATKGATRPISAPHQEQQVPKPTFYEELSYVRRAQSALRDGNAVLALGLMHSLDEIQPKGALLAERNVTQVLALCQLGRDQEAAQVARKALDIDGGAGVYRRRLTGSCAGRELSEGSERDEAEVKDSGE